MDKEYFISYCDKFREMTENLQEKMRQEAKDGKVIKSTGAEFEKRVFHELRAVGIAPENITHSPQKFPDFVISIPETNEKIGIEVKKTDSDKWEVIGGSIYESLKNDTVETFIVMAKFGGEQPEVRIRRYKECIADLKVTHSPRVYLNMDLKEGQDYLTLHDSKDLTNLSDDDLNRRIRQLLRTNKSTWWSGPETVSFSDLSPEEKDAYFVDGVVLFPEVFGGNYENFTPWLVYSCLVWCKNVRDVFSAGGNREIPEIDSILVSAVMYRTFEKISDIVQRIEELTEEEVNKFWKVRLAPDVDKKCFWLNLMKNNLRLSKQVIENNARLAMFHGYSNEEIASIIIKRYFGLMSERLSELDNGRK